MRAALATAYATASTDTGHVSTDTTWFTNPQQTIDNGYRGIHEMTVKAKVIIRAYYGERERFAYFNGCSTGGGQGFMEAQRYPADYDGILAGAPNWRPTRLRAGGHVWARVATDKDPAATIPAATLPQIGNAVLAKCDAIDGIADGVIEDGRTCRFNPDELLCKQGQDPATCLAAPQVEAVQKAVRGCAQPQDGRTDLPRLRARRGVWMERADRRRDAIRRRLRILPVGGVPRSELRLSPVRLRRGCRARRPALRSDPQCRQPESPTIRAAWRKTPRLSRLGGPVDTDLKNAPLLRPAARLLLGAPGHRGRGENFDYKALERVQKFARLFLVPGMGHCSGGPGTDTFDGMGALERGVEHGKAPEKIIASHLTNGVVDKTRPLCPFPKVAVYKRSWKHERRRQLRLPRPRPAPASSP